jgi:hypothetical protein
MLARQLSRIGKLALQRLLRIMLHVFIAALAPP